MSEKFGLYETITSNICGTGNLPNGAKHSIYDENGDLFMTIESDTTIFGNNCIEVNSVALTEDFQTASGNFGNGYAEEAMFLNKDFF